MTLQQFLDKLAKTPRTFGTNTGSTWIRNASGECPIDAVGGDWILADGGLGLSKRTRNSIVECADNYRIAKPRTRARLLKACGI